VIAVPGGNRRGSVTPIPAPEFVKDKLAKSHSPGLGRRRIFMATDL